MVLALPLISGSFVHIKKVVVAIPIYVWSMDTVSHSWLGKIVILISSSLLCFVAT